jgi:HD-GYP domain-containing protein (c-di-GMP phosphodiesterase class II)
MAAVNEGNIFRFLGKPCPTEVLLQALDAAAEQYRLITAERVLLAQTLRGSVKALTDILALVNPAAFGRATRLHNQAMRLAQAVGIENLWPIEMAAMLSQVGCVILPGETIDRVYQHAALTSDEEAMLKQAAGIPKQLLRNIPRLEPVLEILEYQDKRFDGLGPPHDETAGPEIPIGARILKLAGDLDALEGDGCSAQDALATLRRRRGWYDPQLLDAFDELIGKDADERETAELGLHELAEGMIFADDVMTIQGTLLVARGQEVTAGLLERLRNLSRTMRAREPVRMVVPRHLRTEPAFAEIATAVSSNTEM